MPFIKKDFSPNEGVWDSHIVYVRYSSRVEDSVLCDTSLCTYPLGTVTLHSEYFFVSVNLIFSYFCWISYHELKVLHGCTGKTYLSS